MPGYIHHIEWSLSDVNSTRDVLVRHFGFVEFARRSCEARKQIAVRSGETVFLLTQRDENEGELHNIGDDSYPGKNVHPSI